MERMYAVVCFDGFEFSYIECVCDSLTDAYTRCNQLNEEREEAYVVMPTFHVQEGEE